MKQRLFTLAALLAGSVLCAQNPQPYTTRYGKPLNDAIYDSVYYRGFNGNPDTTIFHNETKRVNIVYNSDHLETSELEQGTDFWTTPSVWSNSYRHSFTYDASKRWIGKLTETWNGSGWDNYQRFLIKYNSHGKEISSTFQSWTEATSSWYSYEKDSIVYDAADNILTTMNLGWNSITSTFEISNKTEYTYSGNLRISALLYAYNSALGALAPIVRYSYSYTGPNNDFVLEEYWTGQSWLQTGKFNYDFNDAGQIIKETLKSQQYSVWFKSNVTTNNYNTNGILKKHTQKVWFDPNSDEFSGVQQQYYLHHPQSGAGLIADNTASTQASNDELAVFPNPSNGTVQVKLANNQAITNIEIFNAAGEKVLEQRSSEINMNNAAKGIYFIKVNDGENSYQQKMIIE
ncbi:MAG TPA: T9SS type A sorting domain-containing protein [Bacteroidia bacterium]|jgi:hypothetical protein|nr:T9SS type A sorting domain-containing protein [Bacteroidia bacterium]